ncbi:MAG: alpha/beta hydrolase [Chloroflexia bacterium]|jgi:pimeloyl-ACP methyl ester carboxylesterase|nr:alpha/beta hydrolase [Chloroflexia bacterium]
MQRRYSEWEIETNGVTAVVSEWGSGVQNMVLLHGVSGNRMTWSDLALRLAKDGYHVYAPDLRGCGDSVATGNQIGRTLQSYVDDLESWTQAIGLNSFVLAGHSFGGRLAAEFASQHLDTVERMILIAPAGPDSFKRAAAEKPELVENTPRGNSQFDNLKSIEGPTLEALRQFSAANPGRPATRSVVMRWLGNLDVDDRGHARHIDSHETIDAQMTILRTEDQSDKLAAITTPAVVMRSIDEGVMLRYTIPHYAELLPNARFIDDVDADHSIPSTNPDAVFEALVM